MLEAFIHVVNGVFPAATMLPPLAAALATGFMYSVLVCVAGWTVNKIQVEPKDTQGES